MGEEWLQGEDANDAAGILQKGRFGELYSSGPAAPTISAAAVSAQSCSTGHAVIYVVTELQSGCASARGV